MVEVACSAGADMEDGGYRACSWAAAIGEAAAVVLAAAAVAALAVSVAAAAEAAALAVAGEPLRAKALRCARPQVSRQRNARKKSYSLP